MYIIRYCNAELRRQSQRACVGQLFAIFLTGDMKAKTRQNLAHFCRKNFKKGEKTDKEGKTPKECPT